MKSNNGKLLKDITLFVLAIVLAETSKALTVLLETNKIGIFLRYERN